ncbi:GGDEF domain-containing protein [Ruminococcus sp.]|uniref:GGDEF domain-containing protein n=1 Tax=Ruminococcus sp. TaxID=41978 RepID=UPI0026009049|nr:GGDEF domain-containing protein [Ruminococcus sp.]MBQ8965633.1 GGDEF domain-containing protein [Ruminococcus sp.]
MQFINIAVIVSGLYEEYQYNIIRGINDHAREHGINISYFAAFGGIVDSRTFDIGEYSIYNLTNFSAFDGVLFMSNTFADPVLRGRITDKIKAAGVPTVVFECDEHEEFYNIAIDNYKVMSELVEHLVTQHGARVLNYISGPLANPEAKLRYQAFRDVLERHGIAFDEKRFYHGRFFNEDGGLAIEAFYRSGLPMPDAIVCANDGMALNALTALDKRGCKVPDDVMLTGFDNTFSARNSSPELTTVERPLYESGRKACEILSDVINGRVCPQKTELTASPVFTESCGCPPVNSALISEFRKSTSHKIERTNGSIFMINRLNAALAEADDPETCFEVIAGSLAELGCEKFCLCLTEDWQSAYNTSSLADENSTYAEKMIAPLIWAKGRRFSAGSFESSQMYPLLPENGGNISYFLPLHFSDKCLGYYIITNSDFPINSPICHSFGLALSDSLENIAKLSHLNSAMNELDRLYVIDPLCGIYNRNGFISRADDIFHDCQEKGDLFMLSFIDMDGLKYINDNYGHNEGDYALQRLASAISSCCGKRGICARLGGDEFVICCTMAEASREQSPEQQLERNLDDLNRRIHKPYELSASVGSVVRVISRGDTLHSFIEEADAKMYTVKKQKKLRRESEVK